MNKAADEAKSSGAAFQAAAACVAWALGFAYLALGLWRLVVSPAYPFAHDLNLRWAEMQLLGMGVPPAEIYPTADYPPWSYGWGILMVPPCLSWTTARIYFAAINCAAISGLAVWCLRSQKDQRMGFLVSGAFLAMTSVLYCLSNGQYSVVVAAALAAMLLCLGLKLQVLAGVFASLALIKPHLAIFFLLVLLFRKQWVALASCAVSTIVMSCVPAVMTGRSPVSFVVSMFEKSQGFVIQDQGAAALLSSLGISSQIVAPVIMGGAGAVLLWRRRRADLASLFAVACVFALYWSYHKAYDDVLLVFLLITSVEAGVRKGGLWRWAAVMLLIAFHAVPFRIADHNLITVQFGAMAVRTFTLVAVLKRR